MQILNVALTFVLCTSQGLRVQEELAISSRPLAELLLAFKPDVGWQVASSGAGCHLALQSRVGRLCLERDGLALTSLTARPEGLVRRLTPTMEAKVAAKGGERSVGKAGPAEGKQKALDVSPVKGTRDFPPEDLRLQRWLFDNFRAVSLQFGYEEWDAPVLESEELYTRKAGEEITGQLYCFEDKGGRRVSLRPELTPSLARLILQRGKALTLPAKWFAIGQCWRYERMTKGRRREHYQWNMDIFGVPGVDAEAELLASVVAFFKRLGLSEKDVGIKVSSRKVLQAVLAKYGVSDEQFAPVAVIVDKMDKLPREKVEEELAAIGVEAGAVDGILSALAITSIADLQELVGAESEAAQDLKRLFDLAEGYGYVDWLTFDASVVRGLAYYTGIVFEGFDRAGKLRAICGGGRYDRLLSTFGGEDVPAAGFGFGDAVIVELLKDRNLLPELAPSVDDLVVALDSDLRPAAAGLATQLRANGRNVELVLEDKKMKWAFKRCERNGAARIVLLGSDEWSRGVVNVKELATGEQKEVPVKELA